VDFLLPCRAGVGVEDDPDGIRQWRYRRRAVIVCVVLLASDDAWVRQGGVYALEHLCGLDADYCGQVHALLTAFVRSHAPWPPTRPEAEVDAERARFTGGAADDVGAALAALSRGSMILEGNWSELERVDLRGAELKELKIPLLCLAHSSLERC
jgi:hypothetical protein